nr:metallophosphoesterase [Actinomadura rugatobispora]
MVPETIAAVPYSRARRGGGTESAVLPVQRIGAGPLPDGCEALVVAGDLQGVAASPWGGDPVLLGVAVADHLGVWAEQGLIPAVERVGVVLTGDLYSADRRGATGRVGDVWLAFAVLGCPLVVGVAGNHDVVSAEEVAEFGGVLLDGGSVVRGGVRFAGVGGIVGDPRRPGRRRPEDFAGRLDRVLDEEPAVLVLHEGPHGDAPGQAGSALVRERIASRPPALTLCGHVHWERPVSPLGGGHIINVDARVAVLTGRSSPRR